MSFADLTTAWRARKAGRKREKMGGLARREALSGILFILPWIIGFLTFYLIPMVVSLIFSFTNFELAAGSMFEAMEFAGIDNYLRLFQDPQVGKSLWITVRFMLMSLPLAILWPVGLAALMNAENLWAKRLYRTLYYLPTIVPIVSVAYIWRGFLNSETGWLNRLLDPILLPLNLTSPNWMNDIQWIYPALLLIGFWGVGEGMLRTLVGMQNVPTELYEAARVDGASPIHTFLNITLPMITPVIFYNLVLAVIGLFQYFALALIIGGSESDPGGATLFYNVYLYKQAFVFGNMGYGATLAWVLFAMALLATITLFATAKYWVYYAAEEA